MEANVSSPSSVPLSSLTRWPLLPKVAPLRSQSVVDEKGSRTNSQEEQAVDSSIKKSNSDKGAAELNSATASETQQNPPNPLMNGSSGDASSAGAGSDMSNQIQQSASKNPTHAPREPRTEPPFPINETINDKIVLWFAAK